MEYLNKAKLSGRKISEYLKRIGIPGDVKPDIKFLRRLHRHHLLNIPFENLSIHNNQEIILNINVLFKKIVTQHRGGFCYELNTLFYYLLVSLGFNSKLISARVFNENGKPGPEFDHMAVITEFDGKKWLCDVGFGDSFIEPLEIFSGLEQEENGRKFKITGDEALIFSVEKAGTEWKNEYVFTTESRSVHDFNSMCHYHQTSPDSHFTQKRVCTIATNNGRLTLRDNRLIITENNRKTEIPFDREEMFQFYLCKYFDIKL